MRIARVLAVPPKAYQHLTQTQAAEVMRGNSGKSYLASLRTLSHRHPQVEY